MSRTGGGRPHTLARSMHDDQQWLEGLWDRHAGQVWAYAARRVGREAADDVVADTFVVAWRHRRRRPERDLPWLYGVARRVIAGRRRGEDRRRRLAERAAAQPAVAPVTPDHPVAAADALARLSPRDREALLLIAWEGLTPAEAARVLGITGVSYRMRLSRARRRLDDEMRGEP